VDRAVCSLTISPSHPPQIGRILRKQRQRWPISLADYGDGNRSPKGRTALSVFHQQAEYLHGNGHCLQPFGLLIGGLTNDDRRGDLPERSSEPRAPTFLRRMRSSAPGGLPERPPKPCTPALLWGTGRSFRGRRQAVSWLVTLVTSWIRHSRKNSSNGW
jgi:hypothetical protein